MTTPPVLRGKPSNTVDTCSWCGSVPERNRDSSLVTARLMRRDLAALSNIARKRDDGTTVETLLGMIVHEGVRKLCEVEA